MDLRKYIDYTNLKPLTTTSEIQQLCIDAQKHQFKAVCVAPYHVKTAVDILADSAVQIATVVGFPYGYNTIAPKVEEIKRAIDDGATELDVVVNLAAIKEKRWNFVQNEIDILTTSCQLHDKMIKVIIETGLLTEDEIKKMCEIAATVNVNFVKTSTGINGEGATVEIVKLLKAHLPASIGIKASGGIRDYDTALAMINAGATRIGTSAGLLMIQ